MSPAVAPAPASPRLAALDAARALGVVAMVVGHTLDALLSPAARLEPAVQAYWSARGFTLPLFLTVSGWAVAMALGRSRATGLAVPRARLPRVLLLLAIGYALRWPGWDAAGLRALSPAPWAHLLAFDALHLIALCLLAAALVFALPLRTRPRALLFLALAVLAASLGLTPPRPLVPPPEALPRGAALALAQAVGGSSPFPLVPWAAHFFVGAIVGLAALHDPRRTLRALAAGGAALVLATAWTGVGTMPVGHPLLLAYRTGVVSLALAALFAVPAGVARAVAPLGKASLAVYAVHVPIVYGWSTTPGLAWRVGPALGLPAALAVAAAVLASSYALTLAWGTARRAAAATLARGRAGGAGDPGAA
ncbi:MAG: heparan-alpha-glucosaminide N-acetyltransferase domain-containing protein [Anaeromyxobacteraceae bacterium]